MVNYFKFFDYFGLIVFTFLIVDSIFYLKDNSKDWRAWVRFIIGCLGLIVDLSLILTDEIIGLRFI